MGSLFSTPSRPSPPPLQPVIQRVLAPAPDSGEAQAQVQAAADKKRKAAALAHGPASTILTGGAGLEDPTGAVVQRKKLFGE